MDTQQLHTFERIVREGNFSRAALALGLAQPTASARIQAPEQAVGGPLFERGGRCDALGRLRLACRRARERAASLGVLV